MLTTQDLMDPRLKSGYRHVRFEDYPGRKKPYAAERSVNGKKWEGPHRASAWVAAKDYCDAYNAGQFPDRERLASAGHKGGRRKFSDPEVQAALGVLRDARGQREGKQGYVYCIGEEGGAFVKIGFSTNPAARVPELQTGNPRRLVLRGFIPGTLEDEAALHRKYIVQNVLQEWFRPTTALLSEFKIPAALRGGGPEEVTTR